MKKKSVIIILFLVALASFFAGHSVGVQKGTVLYAEKLDKPETVNDHSVTTEIKNQNNKSKGNVIGCDSCACANMTVPQFRKWKKGN